MFAADAKTCSLLDTRPTGCAKKLPPQSLALLIAHQLDNFTIFYVTVEHSYLHIFAKFYLATDNNVKAIKFTAAA